MDSDGEAKVEGLDFVRELQLKNPKGFIEWRRGWIPLTWQNVVLPHNRCMPKVVNVALFSSLC
jgi:hypothetical protein